MVSSVSGLRTFLVLGVGLIVGGLAGAWATSAVHGSGGERPPGPSSACPPCPVCSAEKPALPPVPERDVDEIAAEDEPEVDLPSDPARAGLPASAVKLASAGLQREIAACLALPEVQGEYGALLLDLTITATGGIGHIREVGVVRREGEISRVEACIDEGARRVQFDWGGGDGESRLRYPVQVGSH
jgi:hypothetical protein